MEKSGMGALIHFDEYGNSQNETIVFLHCAGIVEIYNDVGLEQLSEQYHILLPHLYGSGREVGRDFDFEETKEALIKLIETQNKSKVYLVGHSEGANLALALLQSRPDLFKKAIVSSPMVDASDRIAKAKANYVLLFYGLIKTIFVAKYFASYLEITDAKERQFFIDYWRKISKATWKNYYIDRLNDDVYSAFSHVDTPILYLCGEKEPKVIQTTVDRMSAITQNGSVVKIPNAGHEHPLKNADDFKSNVLSWFRD